MISAQFQWNYSTSFTCFRSSRIPRKLLWTWRQGKRSPGGKKITMLRWEYYYDWYTIPLVSGWREIQKRWEQGAGKKKAG